MKNTLEEIFYECIMEAKNSDCSNELQKNNVQNKINLARCFFKIKIYKLRDCLKISSTKFFGVFLKKCGCKKGQTIAKWYK